MAYLVRPNGNLVVTLRLTLQPGRDDDLIELVNTAPRGALAGLVREAMRCGISPRSAVFLEEAEEEALDMTGLGLEL